MKTRVVLIKGKYIAQVKSHWWNFFWSDLCKNDLDACFGIPLRFDTVGEAIECLKDYVQCKKTSNVVVFEKEMI